MATPWTPYRRYSKSLSIFVYPRLPASLPTQIDLLAASRCNMYSHALVAYLSELKTFAQKAASTFQTISNALVVKPKYDFCVLKELSQNEGIDEPKPPRSPIRAIDRDQSLFFAV